MTTGLATESGGIEIRPVTNAVNALGDQVNRVGQLQKAIRGKLTSILQLEPADPKPEKAPPRAVTCDLEAKLWEMTDLLSSIEDNYSVLNEAIRL